MAGINRIIGQINGVNKGPTIVFFGGIHGNEKAGVQALQSITKTLKSNNIWGSVFAVAGNLKALSKNQRYIDADLNRLWTKEQIESIKVKPALNVEEGELLSLLHILKSILKNNTPPFYFIDLHTTSSKTLPFITINDALINRKFSKQFPVPIVLGIEEYLNGPLLSYINELGYVSLGFESGQHEELSAITNSEAFMYLTLVFSGVLKNNDPKVFSMYFKRLEAQTSQANHVYEIIHLHKIQPFENFKMYNGFKSFQIINKGVLIANSNGKDIRTKHKGFMFMPLYQTKGNEGFFIMRIIPNIYLKLSMFLRHIKIDGLLVLLPGVNWENKEKNTLLVNLKIARFFAKPIFHLLGYRNRHLTKTHLKLNNRERVAKTKMYKREAWFR